MRWQRGNGAAQILSESSNTPTAAAESPGAARNVAWPKVMQPPGRHRQDHRPGWGSPGMDDFDQQAVIGENLLTGSQGERLSALLASCSASALVTLFC